MLRLGLRSFDLRMPEEHNRRLTDHISEYLFAPTERAKANLVKENVWGKIFVTGNTAIDAVNQHLPIAEKKSDIHAENPFRNFRFGDCSSELKTLMTWPFLNHSWRFSRSRPCQLFTRCIREQERGCKKTTCLRKMEALKNVLDSSAFGLPWTFWF